MSFDKVKSSPQGKETLKNAIKQAGLTQEQLHIQTSISLDTIKRLIWTKDLKKGIPASVDRFAVENIAKALNLKPTDIVDPKEWKGDKLFQYRQKFNALIQDKQRHFIGRKFVFDAIENFINTHDKGYFTIVAKPGEGKSSIIANYVDTHPNCIYYFNVRSDSQNRADQFLENVCKQLINCYKLGDDQLSLDATRDGNYFKDLLEIISNKLADNEKLIIVVDALDEVDLNSQLEGSNVLYLPRYLPDKVYFILSRRDEDEIKHRLLIEAPEKIFYLQDYPEKCKEDIRTYIQACIETFDDYKDKLRIWLERQAITKEKFINELVEKSENNFMYLRYVIPQIADGYYQDLQLEYIPQGLQNYYRDHWGRMKMDRIKINIVYLLTVVSRPISRQLLSEFATVGELQVTEYRVQEVLNEWSQFIDKIPVDGETRYKVYHQSFADFLKSDEMVKAAGVEITNIHGIIADRLWQELYGDDEEDE
ncbi:helix-turn-helix transcriptional regulator [Crocosphaera sp. XPORK-15E]|uniref:helix-turn-helix transcriptional regulator n=1 Tax=Crocosphaera sp. XPORK-15E TaxID=3110247 RepID=UPI002B1ED3A0|nr:helix-turn-helix transcriptional regulator [Crocosphaera sp. XPORK-15E]MEA5534410.1 helix-turn-helix transcriptional regulator [Crocosphaera sp. XPORK-15E]